MSALYPDSEALTARQRTVLNLYLVSTLMLFIMLMGEWSFADQRADDHTCCDSARDADTLTPTASNSARDSSSENRRSPPRTSGS